MPSSLALRPTTLPTALLPAVLSFVPRADLLNFQLYRVFPTTHPFVQPSTFLFRRILLAEVDAYLEILLYNDDYEKLNELILMWDAAVSMEEQRLKEKLDMIAKEKVYVAC